MKITLSIEEIKRIVSIHFSLTTEFALEILEESPAAKHFLDTVSVLIGIPHKKIAAIKELRSFFPNPRLDDGTDFGYRSSLAGLGLCKHTIENWGDFSKQVLAANRMPTVVNDEWSF